MNNLFTETITALSHKLEFGNVDAIMFSMLVHQLSEAGVDSVVRQRSFDGAVTYCVESDQFNTGIRFKNETGFFYQY